MKIRGSISGCGTAMWGDIIGDINDQKDLIDLLDKLKDEFEKSIFIIQNTLDTEKNQNDGLLEQITNLIGDINSIKSDLTISLNNQIYDIKKDLDEEITARKNADTFETNEREKADKDLSEKLWQRLNDFAEKYDKRLETECTSRETDINNLHQELQDNVKDIKDNLDKISIFFNAKLLQEINDRSKAITDESKARTDADNDLKIDLNKETNRASGVEIAIKQLLTDEIKTRADNDSTLAGRIDTLNDNLYTQIIQVRQDHDNDVEALYESLHNEISINKTDSESRDNNLDNHITTIDIALQETINTVSSNLYICIQQIDDALNKRIDGEHDRIDAIEKNLNALYHMIENKIIVEEEDEELHITPWDWID